LHWRTYSTLEMHFPALRAPLARSPAHTNTRRTHCQQLTISMFDLLSLVSCCCIVFSASKVADWWNESQQEHKLFPWLIPLSRHILNIYSFSIGTCTMKLISTLFEGLWLHQLFIPSNHAQQRRCISFSHPLMQYRELLNHTEEINILLQHWFKTQHMYINIWFEQQLTSKTLNYYLSLGVNYFLTICLQPNKIVFKNRC